MDMVRVTQKFLISNADSACWLKRNPAQSENILWHLRVAEEDHLSEQSEKGKLPQHKTRALATQRELITPRGVHAPDRGGSA